MVYQEIVKTQTKGFCDIIDITDQVQDIVNKSEIKQGICLIFVPGSTAGITTIEANANLEEDLKEILEVVAPQNKKYHHDEKWNDGNGFSHVRATLIGPSLSVPILDGQLTLGTWQQIVLCDFDNRSRDREIVVEVIA